jgi:EAL domain-containing protein (putative c-di-GMP-specific phosphodiesterase class I)
VVLEITEREAVRDLARFESVLTSYREAGFRFALDDVGEGHSTFELIAATSPEYLKISALLVQRHTERSARLAIRGIVAFARVSEAQVIAEGIENEVDRIRLQELGVTLGQGYALGHPVPATELASLQFEPEEAHEHNSSQPLVHVIPASGRPRVRRPDPLIGSVAL